MAHHRFNTAFLDCFDNGLLPWRLRWYVGHDPVKVTFRSLIEKLIDSGDVKFHRGWAPLHVQPDFAAAETFIRSTGANITSYPGDAIVLNDDWINVPPPNSFNSRTDFFFTAFQLLARWAEDRLGWTGHHLAAKLVAEIAASILCDEVGLVLPAEVGDRTRLVMLWRHTSSREQLFFFDGACQAVRTVEYLSSLG